MSNTLWAIIFGVLFFAAFFAGVAGWIKAAKPTNRQRKKIELQGAKSAREIVELAMRREERGQILYRAPHARRDAILKLIRFALGLLGILVVYQQTQLIGLCVLIGGLGWFMPAFIMGPRLRRERTREAEMWQDWARLLGELAEAGASLYDSLRTSAQHLPPELAPVAKRAAVIAEIDGIEPALNTLAETESPWGAQLSAGLRIAARAGGSISKPMKAIVDRIEDITDVHRQKTSSVVKVWVQTLALMVVGFVTMFLLWRNNPEYFTPFGEGIGQLLLLAISVIIVFCVGYLTTRGVVPPHEYVLGTERGARTGKKGKAQGK